MTKEYLVTGQGYELSDSYKQTILLHDTFFASDYNDAREMFDKKFQDTHKIIKIYSIQDLTE